MRTTSAIAGLPAAVGGAALTVLTAACAAAVVLGSAPTAPAAPATPAEGRMVAAYQTAPTPVRLSFPAPTAEPAPASDAVAAPAPPDSPPPDSPPPADPHCSGDGWEQRRGAAAVASLRRPADAAAVPVSFSPGRPGVLGLAHLESRTVELFVRSCARQSDALLQHVLAHELGHLLDVTRLDDRLRAEWRAVRGIPAGTPWFGCDRCSDFATPAGDFAETYAQWQRGARDSRSQLAPPAAPVELERLAERFFQPL